MLKDIPYRKTKENPRAFEIMTLHDQSGTSFRQLAGKYQLSTARIREIYNQTKRMQLRLYLNHIGFILGHETIEMIREEFGIVLECYWEYPYACAYLEKKYFRILEEYR